MIQTTKISNPIKKNSTFHYLPMLLRTMAPIPSCWGLARNFLATKRGSKTTLWLDFSGIVAQLRNLAYKIRRRRSEFISNEEKWYEMEREEVGCQRRLSWVKIWYERDEFDIFGVFFGLWDSLSPLLTVCKNVMLALWWGVALFWLKYWLLVLQSFYFYFIGFNLVWDGG